MLLCTCSLTESLRCARQVATIWMWELFLTGCLIRTTFLILLPWQGLKVKTHKGFSICRVTRATPHRLGTGSVIAYKARFGANHFGIHQRWDFGGEAKQRRSRNSIAGVARSSPRTFPGKHSDFQLIFTHAAGNTGQRRSSRGALLWGLMACWTSSHHWAWVTIERTQMFSERTSCDNSPTWSCTLHWNEES